MIFYSIHIILLGIDNATFLHIRQTTKRSQFSMYGIVARLDAVTVIGHPVGAVRRTIEGDVA